MPGWLSNQMGGGRMLAYGSSIFQCDGHGWILSAYGSSIFQCDGHGWILSAYGSSIFQCDGNGWILSAYGSSICQRDGHGWILSAIEHLSQYQYLRLREQLANVKYVCAPVQCILFCTSTAVPSIPVLTVD
jgi:retron-type reverse transcriptase